MTTPATDFAAPAPVADSRRLRRRVFPGRADQVARAREFTARTLAGCPAVADAVLLTSELATNALLHTATGAGRTFTVTICHLPSIACVAVTDSGPLPAPPSPAGRESPSGDRPSPCHRLSPDHPLSPGAGLPPGDGLSPSGRGLLLVASIAARWGYHGISHGRVTWFELPCAESSGDGSGCAGPARGRHAGS